MASDVESRIALAVAAIPGLVAIGLGVLYAAGAVDVMGQLRGADLRAMDYLPLVPLEQMLGRGIGALLPALAVALLLVAYVLWLTGPQASSPSSPLGSVAGYRLAKVSAGLALASVVFGLPLPMLATLLGAATVAGVLVQIAWGYIKRRFENWPTTVAGTLSGIVLLFAWINLEAYFHPRPLPKVTAYDADGRKLSGELVVTNGKSVYVKTGDSVQTIEASRSVVAEPEPPREDSLAEWLLDRL